MKDQSLAIAPAPYVTLALFERISGYTDKAVRRKIEEGVWRFEHEVRRAPDGRILVSIAGYTRWVESS